MLRKRFAVCVATVLLLIIASLPSTAKASKTTVLPLSKAADEFVPHRVKRSYTNVTFGGGIGKTAGYFLDIAVGSSGQTMSVLVDTGSSDTLLPSDGGCTGCPSRRFKTAQSSTLVLPNCTTVNCTTCGTNQQCVISTSYLDGTAAIGTVYEDKISIGAVSGKAYFGALTFVNGTINNGIIGLAYQQNPLLFASSSYHGHQRITLVMTISAAGVSPVLDMLIAQNSANYPNGFGMCMADVGGAFAIGDPLYAVTTAPISWIPLLTPLDFYRIPLQSIRFANETTANLNVKAVVDSGSTMVTMSSKNYQLILTQIRTWCTANPKEKLCEMAENQAKQTGFSGSLCVDFKPSALARWPNFTYVLGNGTNAATFTLTPRDYIRYIKGLWKIGYCGWLGISQLPTLTDSDGSDLIILGDTFMRAFYTHFDRDGSRVGFAPVNHTLCGKYLKSGLIWPWWVFLVMAAILLCCCCCISLCIYGCYRCCCKNNHSTDGYRRHDNNL